MRPPLRLDLSWRDLLAGGFHSFASARPKRRERVEELWSQDGNALASLCVRSAFDLWLSAKGFPEGSEILFSGFTIPDMPQIAEWHGLKPVFLDLDLETLSPSGNALRKASTERTKAVVVAHLFGARSDLSEIADVCDEKGIALVEDAAQAYAADGWRGSDRAAISLFSFGTIKTSTALGGALSTVREPVVLKRMRVRQSEYPVRSRHVMATKVARAAAIKLFSSGLLYGGIVKICEKTDRDHGSILNASIRGFPGGIRPERLRVRLDEAQLALLERRLREEGAPRIRQRAARAVRLGESLTGAQKGLQVPGESAPKHDHWVLAALTPEPDRTIAALRSAGLDATRHGGSNRPLGEGPGLARLRNELIYVPAGHDLTEREIGKAKDALEKLQRA